MNWGNFWSDIFSLSPELKIEKCGPRKVEDSIGNEKAFVSEKNKKRENFIIRYINEYCNFMSVPKIILAYMALVTFLDFVKNIFIVFPNVSHVFR